MPLPTDSHAKQNNLSPSLRISLHTRRVFTLSLWCACQTLFQTDHDKKIPSVMIALYRKMMHYIEYNIYTMCLLTARKESRVGWAGKAQK